MNKRIKRAVTEEEFAHKGLLIMDAARRGIQDMLLTVEGAHEFGVGFTISEQSDGSLIIQTKDAYFVICLRD